MHRAVAGDDDEADTQPASGQERAEAAGQGLLGTPAPVLVVETIDGESIDLGALYGTKAVYLKFWATWCVPCREQMPHFERAYETAGPDLAVIAVNTGFNDSLPAVRAVIRDAGLAGESSACSNAEKSGRRRLRVVVDCAWARSTNSCKATIGYPGHAATKRRQR